MRCRDPLDYLIILLGIDDRNIICFLVTDEYIARVLSTGTRRQDEGQDKGGETDAEMVRDIWHNRNSLGRKRVAHSASNTATM